MVKSDQAPLATLNTSVETRHRQPATSASERLLSMDELLLPEQSSRKGKATKAPAGPTLAEQKAELEKKLEEKEKSLTEAAKQLESANRELSSRDASIKKLQLIAPPTDSEIYAAETKYGPARDAALSTRKSDPKKQLEDSFNLLGVSQILRDRVERGESVDREISIGRFEEVKKRIGGRAELHRGENAQEFIDINKGLISRNLAVVARVGTIDPDRLSKYYQSVLDHESLNESAGDKFKKGGAKVLGGIGGILGRKAQDSIEKKVEAADKNAGDLPAAKIFLEENAKR